MMSIWIQDNLGGVIEKHTGSIIGEVVAEPVLGGVVDPLLDPDFGLPGLYNTSPVASSRLSRLILSVSILEAITSRPSIAASSVRSHSILSTGVVIRVLGTSVGSLELANVGVGRRTSKG